MTSDIDESLFILSKDVLAQEIEKAKAGDKDAANKVIAHFTMSEDRTEVRRWETNLAESGDDAAAMDLAVDAYIMAKRLPDDDPRKRKLISDARKWWPLNSKTRKVSGFADNIEKEWQRLNATNQK